MDKRRACRARRDNLDASVGKGTKQLEPGPRTGQSFIIEPIGSPRRLVGTMAHYPSLPDVEVVLGEREGGADRGLTGVMVETCKEKISFMMEWRSPYRTVLLQ